MSIMVPSLENRLGDPSPVVPSVENQTMGPFLDSTLTALVPNLGAGRAKGHLPGGASQTTTHKITNR